MFSFCFFWGGVNFLWGFMEVLKFLLGAKVYMYERVVM